MVLGGLSNSPSIFDNLSGGSENLLIIFNPSHIEWFYCAEYKQHYEPTYIHIHYLRYEFHYDKSKKTIRHLDYLYVEKTDIGVKAWIVNEKL